jgi:major membrane immunogen (membrane-anchored lipoprotein)
MNCPRFIVVFVALLAVNLHLSAQQLTGIWKGYFITKDQNQYKVEVQIKEKGGKLTGVTYSYLDIRFYGKASMTGNADKKLGKVSMQG